MSSANDSPQYFVLVRSTAEASAVYSLEHAARLAGVAPEMLLHYCRSGLLGDQRASGESEPTFDDEALYAIRRLDYFRRHHEVNLRALPLVYHLAGEIERLSGELRSLRDRHGA